MCKTRTKVSHSGSRYPLAAVGTAARLEEGPPRCVRCSACCNLHPVKTPRFGWDPFEDKTRLIGCPAAFSGVTSSTCRDHVVPAMFTALNLGNHVINVFCRGSTVLTAVVITHEHGSARDWNRSCVRNANIPTQPDNCWDVKKVGLCVPRHAERCNELRTLPEQEHHCTPRSHNGERLIACVEYQRS
jgi:hypothetical protein